MQTQNVESKTETRNPKLGTFNLHKTENEEQKHNNLQYKARKKKTKDSQPEFKAKNVESKTEIRNPKL